MLTEITRFSAKRLSFLATAALLAVPLTMSAQKVPTFTGKGKVTEALDTDKGALFDIGAGVTMFFPVGLSVGKSRLVTLMKGKKASVSAIVKGFKAVGPTLDFNGALSISDRPMVLSYKTKRPTTKAGQRLVLAMEVGTFCDAHNKRFKLKSGLCSGWELRDASYDNGGQQLVAKLDSTGGLRMQFGVAPEAEDK